MKKALKIKEVACLWKKDKQFYVKQSTLAAYALTLENHILPAFGNKYKLTEADVQKFVLQKLHEGLSQKTVRGILIVLKMIQQFGMKNEYLPSMEWEIKYPTEQRKYKLEVMSIDNQRKIMQYLTENFTYRNLGIYLSLCTGMRIGEICALKWKDIDLKAETICVRSTIERVYIVEDGTRHTQLVIGTPKTRNSFREIPLSLELLKLIQPIKRGVKEDDFVLTNCAKPTEPRTYRNYYKQLLKKLDIPDMKFHGLRHSFATRCIESQCDYKTVSDILGHSNISITLDLYVHPNMEQKRKCINKMFDSLK